MHEIVISRTQAVDADFDALIGPTPGRRLPHCLGDPRQPRRSPRRRTRVRLQSLAQAVPAQEGRPARPWFLTIVANQCRSERRTRWWSVIRLPEVDAGGSHQAEGGAQSIDIDRELAKLPRKDRLALFLYFYLDLPLDEVGTVLGVSAGGTRPVSTGRLESCARDWA